MCCFHPENGLSVVLNSRAMALILFRNQYVQSLPLCSSFSAEGRQTHLSPLGWEHINLSGDYVWRNNLKLESGKYRPLRSVDTELYKSSLSVGYFPFSKRTPVTAYAGTTPPTHCIQFRSGWRLYAATRHNGHVSLC